MAGPELDVNLVQSLKPGAQQRRRSKRLREHPITRAKKGRLPQASGPAPQVGGRERPDGRLEKRAGLAKADQHVIDWFAMSDVEATAASEQELAANRAFVFKDFDTCARNSHPFSSNQARWATAYNRYIWLIARHRRNTTAGNPAWSPLCAAGSYGLDPCH